LPTKYGILQEYNHLQVEQSMRCEEVRVQYTLEQRDKDFKVSLKKIQIGEIEYTGAGTYQSRNLI